MAVELHHDSDWELAQVAEFGSIAKGYLVTKVSA
jgi:hypothetical protein